MFEAVRTYPGYGIATLIYNNLINLIFGHINVFNYYIIGYLIIGFDRKKWISDSDCTAKNT